MIVTDVRLWGDYERVLERRANNAEVMSSIFLRASVMEEKSLSATDRGTNLSSEGFHNQHLKKNARIPN